MLMRKSMHLIGYFHIYVSRCTIQRREKIACLVCDGGLHHIFSQIGTETHYPVKTNLNMNSSLLRNFWYYLHFQVRGCTINISHTSFWHDIKACVLQHLGKDLTLLK